MDTASIPTYPLLRRMRLPAFGGRSVELGSIRCGVRPSPPVNSPGGQQWLVAVRREAIVGGDYNALSLGLGRDLLVLGALSFDTTYSRARLPIDDGTKKAARTA